jgi:hypothetical protein
VVNRAGDGIAVEMKDLFAGICTYYAEAGTHHSDSHRAHLSLSATVAVCDIMHHVMFWH